MRTLLINWVYHPPVGHVVEALRLAHEFKTADPEARISVLLNRRAPAELADCVPAVAEAFSIDLARAGDLAGLPADLPRDWDYVFTDPRAATVAEPGLARFHAAFRGWVRATAVNRGWDPESMPPRTVTPLRLDLPPEARAAAASRSRSDAAPRVSVLLGAGSHYTTPSLAFWTTLFEAFLDRHPRAEIVLLGSLSTERTSTRGVTRGDLDGLLERFPSIHDAFDAGLLVQLALAERCAVHVSPHSGMSFAVQAVGVPWLALSGQAWHEFLLNGVPLVAVYPDCPLYPCFREMYPECRTLRDAGRRTPCIEDDALLGKLDEILAGMETLIAGELPYAEAARRHQAALRERLGPDSWTVVDWPAVVAEEYVF